MQLRNSFSQSIRYLGSYTHNNNNKKKKKRHRVTLPEELDTNQMTSLYMQKKQYLNFRDEKRANSYSLQQNTYHKTPTLSNNIKLKNLEQTFYRAQLPDIGFNGRQTITNGYFNTNDYKLDKLLKESRMLQTKIKFFQNQKPSQSHNQTQLGGNIVSQPSSRIRDLSQQNYNSSSQARINENDEIKTVNIQAVKKPRNSSFIEVQSSIEEKLGESSSKLKIKDDKQEFQEYQNPISPQQLQSMQQSYKLPSIKSNENFQRDDENQSKLSSGQQITVPNFILHNAEENKNTNQKVLVQNGQIPKLVRNSQQKRSSTIKEMLNETYSYRMGQKGAALSHMNNYSRKQQIQPQNLTQINQKNVQSLGNIQREEENVALTLTEEEKTIYGNRFPKDYKKVHLLGRGGCALVWLAKDPKNDDQLVAIKQFPKANGTNANLQSGYKELAINKRFFSGNGQANDAYISHPGLSSLCKMIDSKEDKFDLWLIFELCGKPLSKSIFDVKGEFYKGERIYQVLQKEQVYNAFEENDCRLFKDFILKMAHSLMMFQQAGIVHSDLKSENIMIKYNQDEDKYDFKIIDLGSAFNFQKINTDIELTTPEYLAPDILEYLDQKTSMLMQQSSQNQVDLSRRQMPYSVDVWSLGAILLEMVVGFPLWLSYKGRIVKQTTDGAYNEYQQASLCMTGLFGIQGRNPKKIQQRQIQVVKQLRQILKKNFDSSLCLGGLNNNALFMDLLSSMLELNPKLRLSPREIIEHPFLQ